MFEEADEPFPDIEESAALALNSLLPEKLKEKYKKAYKDFEHWCSEKRVQLLTGLHYGVSIQCYELPLM
jgi:hypothetical protein